MAHPQTPVSGIESVSSNISMQDASTQTIWTHAQNASTQTAEDDSSPLEQPPATSDTSEESRKRKISNGQNIAHHESGVFKVPRSETEDRFASSSSEKSCGDEDFEDAPSARSHTLLESSRLASSSQELSKSEELELCLRNVQSDAPSYDTGNLKEAENIASNKGDSQIEKAPSEKSGITASSVCSDDVRNVESGVQSYNTGNLKEAENIASNKGDSQSQKAPSEKSGITASSVCPDDDMPVDQSSSRFEEDISKSEELLESPKNESSLSQRPPVETEQKGYTCLTCKKTASDHEELLDGKVVYSCCHKCCRCLFLSDSFDSLQMHIFKDHSQPLYCSVCRLNFSETGSHARGGQCEICKQDFECKYQLEEHYSSVHDDLYKTHCRVCKKDFEAHNIFKNKILYRCCFKECDFIFCSISLFNRHLSKHSCIKFIKCEVCGYYFKRPVRY